MNSYIHLRLRLHEVNSEILSVKVEEEKGSFQKKPNTNYRRDGSNRNVTSYGSTATYTREDAAYTKTTK